MLFIGFLAACVENFVTWKKKKKWLKGIFNIVQKIRKLKGRVQKKLNIFCIVVN